MKRPLEAVPIAWHGSELPRHTAYGELVPMPLANAGQSIYQNSKPPSQGLNCEIIDKFAPPETAPDQGAICYMTVRRCFICLALVLVTQLGPQVGAARGSMGEHLQALLAGSRALPKTTVPIDLARAQRLYAYFDNRPVWWAGHGWSDKAILAQRALADAAAEGLYPDDYHPAARPLPPGTADPLRLAEAELILSAQLMRYIVDLQAGRKAPKEIDPQLFIYPREVAADVELRRGLSASDFEAWLASLPPSSSSYRRLREVLAAYRRLEDMADWPRLAEGPKLEEGAEDPRVPVLRRQLAMLGDLSGARASEGSIFDSALMGAVMRFQARHGLDVDGVVGPATRAALNQPISRRIAKIMLNMERLRWMPDDLGERHVLVNIAAFELDAVENGRVIHRMPVIVGRHYRRTPVLSDRMINLILNPTWTATPNIARQDILPKVKADQSYLARQKIRVFSGWDEKAVELDPMTIDWSAVTPKSLVYKFRQESGPQNALGRVRFSLENKLNIYLHDTPDRGLFSKNIRTFSSGCIRVGDPLALAAFAMKGSAQWSVEALASAMEAGDKQRINLISPLPVHLTYVTAWAEESGELQIREDLYGRDRLLARALGLDDGS